MPWLSYNSEEVQVAREKIKTFKEDNTYGVARLLKIRSEIDIEVPNVVKRKSRRKEIIRIV